VEPLGRGVGSSGGRKNVFSPVILFKWSRCHDLTVFLAILRHSFDATLFTFSLQFQHAVDVTILYPLVI
jgi:hypothetical protein